MELRASFNMAVGFFELIVFGSDCVLCDCVCAVLLPVALTYLLSPDNEIPLYLKDCYPSFQNHIVLMIRNLIISNVIHGDFVHFSLYLNMSLSNSFPS